MSVYTPKCPPHLSEAAQRPRLEYWISPPSTSTLNVQNVRMVEPIYARNARVLDSALVDGEKVLLHLETGQYHELNPIGAAIWERIDGQRSTSAIVSELRHLVEDPPADLEEVILEFIEQLKQRDLID